LQSPLDVHCIILIVEIYLSYKIRDGTLDDADFRKRSTEYNTGQDHSLVLSPSIMYMLFELQEKVC